MQSTAPSTCATCGGLISTPRESGGHCPRCLFKITFGGEDAPPGDTETAWMCFSGIDLYEEIGRGGMGVVYRARQIALDRIVAVKVLLRARFASAAERGRFHREAQAAARLRHPGIIGIIDVGETEGVPWFCMEHIAGESLDRRVREHPMEAREAARLLLEVAIAVQHAHDHGVLHRDLKPSNILLDQDGTPRIGDFGIARIATPGHEITRAGQMLGSPGYAGPELAFDGKSDARTDVYGMGALFYHLLTGKPPFQGPTLDSILLQLREDDPLSIRSLNPSVPVDLDTICLKCLGKSPERRYQSAAALAEDIQRFLDGKPILARPLGILGRSVRWTRRHPAMASLVALIALLIAAMIGGSLAFARHQARSEHRTALISEARSLRQSRSASARTDALAKLQQAWAIAPSAEIRHEAAVCLALPAIGEPQITQTAPPDATRSGDGRFAAGFSASDVVVRDLSNNIEVFRLADQKPGSLLKLDDHGRRLAIAAPGDGQMEIVELESGRVLSACPHPMPLDDIDWSGDLLATACQNRFIYIWNDEGQLKHRLSGHESPGIRLAFRPLSQDLASTAADRHIRLWHAARGAEIIRFDVDHQAHSSLWWAADGMTLHGAIDSGNTESFAFQPATSFDLLAPPQDEPHSENLGSADLSADGRYAVVIDEHSARVWDFQSARLIHQRPKHPGQWLSARFTKTGNGLLFCGWSDPLSQSKLLGDSSGPRVSEDASTILTGHGNLIRDISADGDHLVLSNDGTGHFIIVSRDGANPLQIPSPGTLAATISPAANWLVTSSYREPGAKVWSLPDGALLHVLCEGETVMQTCALGTQRLAARTSAGIRVFHTSDWSPASKSPSGQHFHGMAGSPDGQLLATLGDNQIHILETRNFTEILRLTPPAHAGWLGDCDLIFDADASHLLVHTAIGSAMRWDLKSLQSELAAMGFNPP